MEELRTRLKIAAIELFQEQGYEKTTVTEIARRVGVTERTFFRHFADKREVLFDGEAALLEALAKSIVACPPQIKPVDVLFLAFNSVLPLLAGNRSFAVSRQAIISSTPALRERELAKHAFIANALADLLQARGCGCERASLAAHTAMNAFVQATLAWLDEPELNLAARLSRAREELFELFAPTHRPTFKSAGREAR